MDHLNRIRKILGFCFPLPRLAKRYPLLWKDDQGDCGCMIKQVPSSNYVWIIDPCVLLSTDLTVFMLCTFGPNSDTSCLDAEVSSVSRV